MNPDPSANNDLRWEAWRYVAGEMSDLEQSAFEHQLFESQLLREYVSEAVELNDVVRVAESSLTVAKPHGTKPHGEHKRPAESLLISGNSERDATPSVASHATLGSQSSPATQRKNLPTRGRRSRWTHRIRWMALGAAASLMTALAWQWTPPLSTSPDGITPDAGGQEALARAWSETRGWLADEPAEAPLSELEWTTDGSLSEAEQTTQQLAGVFTEPLAEVTTPDWMLAALRAQSQADEPLSGEPLEEI